MPEHREFLQRGGIYACDCYIEPDCIWVGILVLDPAKVFPGETYEVYDLDTDEAFTIRLAPDAYTPAYRQTLERVHD